MGGPGAGRRAVIVHLLAKKSEVNYFSKSHLYVFPAEKGARLTRELSRSALEEAGCEVFHKVFETGGVYVSMPSRIFQDQHVLTSYRVILDARLGREIREGYAITAIFTSEELVARFELPQMLLPDSPGLRKKITEMQEQSQNIRLNFTFKDTSRDIGT